MTANELARVLQRKKLQHLYVRSDDSKLFLNQFKDVIAQKMNQLQAGGAAAIETASMVHDMCHQMFHKLGFSTELKEVTEVNINLTLASIGSDPRLQELLDAKVFQQKNYQSSHSVLLAYAACSIAANLAWSSVPTFQKLVLASLMHDISLNDPTLSKFQTRKEIEAQRESLPPANYQAVVNHSNNSADIVRQFGFAIAEVDLIVSQHHERPDGSGFPLGINATKISPLASILIVAHDLVEEVLNQGEKFHLPDFVNSRAQYYSSAVFKMALAGLAQECAPANTLATAK